MEKSKIIKEDGFIAIIALSIFLLLSLFGIIVQRVTTDSLNNVATTNKYNEASDIADSVIEYLQYEMSQREAGFSMDEVECVYVEDTTQQGWNEEICDNIDEPLGIGGKEITITMEVEGRNDALNEKDYLTGYGPTGGDVFVIPHLGTGDAGSKCDVYQSEIEEANWDSAVDAHISRKGQIVETTENEFMEQIDYPCNWNKLSFGSSSTDRVAIPLYYDESEAGDVQSIIVNPFLDIYDTNTDVKVNQLIVRIRPPCEPCLSTDCPADKTFCDGTQTHRYVLDDGGGQTEENDIVVQWQISGECDGEPCSLIPYAKNVMNHDYIDVSASSVITELEINNTWGINFEVLHFALNSGISTDDYKEYLIIDELSGEIEKPTLILFLNEKLLTSPGLNVPYLEYQILTDNPVGSPNTQAITTINIDGYVFEKTLTQQEETSLIDFAVQN